MRPITTIAPIPTYSRTWDINAGIPAKNENAEFAVFWMFEKIDPNSFFKAFPVLVIVVPTESRRFMPLVVAFFTKVYRFETDPVMKGI